MLNTPENLDKDGLAALKVITGFLASKEEDDAENDSKAFYSPHEWKNRGEEYGRDSVLVIVYDGSDLRQFFSMDACYEVGCMMASEGIKTSNPYASYEALQEALGKAGFYFEECTCWYAAVYKS